MFFLANRPILSLPAHETRHNIILDYLFDCYSSDSDILKINRRVLLAIKQAELLKDLFQLFVTHRAFIWEEDIHRDSIYHDSIDGKEDLFVLTKRHLFEMAAKTLIASNVEDVIELLSNASFHLFHISLGQSSKNVIILLYNRKT